MEMSDVLVIGGGPAGLNASLYAARKALSVTLVSTDIGGQMMLTNEIENYLGFQSVTGIELAEKMESHVRQYPVDFVTAGVKALKHLSDGSFAVQLDDGKSLQGKTVIVTAGKKSRTLDIPGEIEYTGRGVSYCATCDGPFYRNKTVAIVGGGDSAVQAAIEMSMISQKVYLLVRSRIRAAEIVVKRMYEKENIEVLMEYIPLRINGERKVTSLVVRNKKDEKEIELAVDGVFVEAGGIPNNSYLPKDVITNSLGEIITDKEGKTNIPGLFAAGDVTDGKNKQTWFRFQKSSPFIRYVIEYSGLSGNWTDYKTKAMTDGEWHHYVCVHTNGSTYLYIDGVKAAEALNKGLKPIDRKPYFIGAMYRGAEGSRSYENFMDGYIDDYLVYNRAFTAAEAKALYDSMK